MRRPVEIVRETWGTNRVLVLGHQVFSYERDPAYARLYARRFDGLSEADLRTILAWQFAEAGNSYALDLDTPRSLNEKLNWLKLYYHDPLMTQCADKVGVRDYIREKVGEKYLVPVLGVYDSADDIDFDKLPNRFAMKVNWGSGQNVICPDKSMLDVEAVRSRMRRWMRPESNHYFNHFEWGYKDIRPKIVVEQFIEGFDGLPDYKLLCFNGTMKVMYVAQNRQLGPKALRFTFHDREFRRLPFEQDYPAAERAVERPSCLEEMISLAEKLAAPFPFCRVDFYIERSGVLKIGELTFYHLAGLVPIRPVEWDYRLGEMLELPKVQ